MQRTRGQNGRGVYSLGCKLSPSSDVENLPSICTSFGFFRYVSTMYLYPLIISTNTIEYLGSLRDIKNRPPKMAINKNTDNDNNEEKLARIDPLQGLLVQSMSPNTTES